MDGRRVGVLAMKCGTLNHPGPLEGKVWEREKVTGRGVYPNDYREEPPEKQETDTLGERVVDQWSGRGVSGRCTVTQWEVPCVGTPVPFLKRAG